VWWSVVNILVAVVGCQHRTDKMLNPWVLAEQILHVYDPVPLAAYTRCRLHNVIQWDKMVLS